MGNVFQSAHGCSCRQKTTLSKSKISHLRKTLDSALEEIVNMVLTQARGAMFRLHTASYTHLLSQLFCGKMKDKDSRTPISLPAPHSSKQ